MTASDGIEVTLLHHLQILFHLFQPDHKPRHRIGVMTVHAFEFDGSSIYIENSIFYTDFPDSNPVCDHFPFCF